MLFEKGPCYVVQLSLKLTSILLPQLLEQWDKKYMSLCLAGESCFARDRGVHFDTHSHAGMDGPFLLQCVRSMLGSKATMLPALLPHVWLKPALSTVSRTSGIHAGHLESTGKDLEIKSSLLINSWIYLNLAKIVQETENCSLRWVRDGCWEGLLL